MGLLYWIVGRSLLPACPAAAVFVLGKNRGMSRMIGSEHADCWEYHRCHATWWFLWCRDCRLPSAMNFIHSGFPQYRRRECVRKRYDFQMRPHILSFTDLNDQQPSPLLCKEIAQKFWRDFLNGSEVSGIVQSCTGRQDSQSYDRNFVWGTIRHPPSLGILERPLSIIESKLSRNL